MANTNIFLGSGASVTFVPEVDIYLKPSALNADKNTLTIDSAFTGNFDLVNNLYVGCVLEFYDNGTHTTTHRVWPMTEPQSLFILLKRLPLTLQTTITI